MKLDKIKFAKLIVFCASQGMSVGNWEIEQLDEMIDIEGQNIYPANGHVDDLMRLMVAGTQKIEAIKTHRAITGFGLKESKDAVEKYWPVERKDVWTKEQLLNKLNDSPRSQLDTAIIEAFIKSL